MEFKFVHPSKRCHPILLTESPRIYSLTCSHCAQLKNAIIEYALYNVYPIYFVQESSSVVIDEVKASKINVTNIDELGIRGFPTLLSLKNKTVIHQYVGVTPIKNELLI